MVTGSLTCRKKRKLKIEQTLFYFDLSENFPLCLTMKYKADTGTMLLALYFTAVVHFKTPREVF